ncbi:hypothetical protein HPB52_001343 [Rhipicephalus sanguineus]|uniref:Uncharacterized protein n=1 Tax=Rhipicephalus sanguineus TaxID=34632 RepID=A0A9D4QCM8_RHISA|nr:hypothetical protein HPB52_001343 [Rhipicephalus sanguineus]
MPPLSPEWHSPPPLHMASLEQRGGLHRSNSEGLPTEPHGARGRTRTLTDDLLRFSRVPESIEEDIGADFSGCDELCNEVRKATGCVSDTEDGEIAFEEYALYETHVPVTGMLSDTNIVEMAMNDTDDYAD